MEIHNIAELKSLPMIGYPQNGAMDTYLSALQGREGITLRFTCRVPDEVAIAALVTKNFGCAVVAEVNGLEEFDWRSKTVWKISAIGKRQAPP